MVPFLPWYILRWVWIGICMCMWGALQYSTSALGNPLALSVELVELHILCYVQPVVYVR